MDTRCDITPEALRARYEGGATLHDLVNELALPACKLQEILLHAGTQMRNLARSRVRKVKVKHTINIEVLRARYEGGAKLKDLANDIAVAAPKIRRLLVEAGTQMRRPGWNPPVRRGTGKHNSIDLRLLRAAYESGARVEQLANEHGTSVTTIYKKLAEAGTRLRPQGSRTGRLAHADDIERLHSLGQIDADIARELKLSREYIRQIRNKLGLQKNRKVVEKGSVGD